MFSSPRTVLSLKQSTEPTQVQSGTRPPKLTTLLTLMRSGSISSGFVRSNMRLYSGSGVQTRGYYYYGGSREAHRVQPRRPGGRGYRRGAGVLRSPLRYRAAGTRAQDGVHRRG